MTLKCVVIDDEPLARGCTTNYVNDIDFLQLSGTGSNPLNLTRLMAEQAVDLVFLDMQMPVISGIEFLKMVPNRPMVILTTAFPIMRWRAFSLM